MEIDSIKERKSPAPESEQIQKARKKIFEQLEKQNSLISPSNLAKSLEKIHQGIAVNTSDRVPVKKKGICLFDNNHNIAKVSNKVAELARKLSEKYS